MLSFGELKYLQGFRFRRLLSLRFFGRKCIFKYLYGFLFFTFRMIQMFIFYLALINQLMSIFCSLSIFIWSFSPFEPVVCIVRWKLLNGRDIEAGEFDICMRTGTHTLSCFVSIIFSVFLIIKG